MADSSKTPSELDLLLDALADLASSRGEPHICEAYRLAIENSTLINDMPQFAECLHRKWLTERQVISPAVQICRVLGNADTGSGTFSNLLYCILMNDYKDRHQLRKVSRHFFNNSVQFLFEYFYSEYRSARLNLQQAAASGSDSLLSGRSSKDDQSKSLQELCQVSKNDTSFYLKGYSLLDDLVNPMYDYLNMLLDGSATESETRTLHAVMFMMGPVLDELQPQRMEELTLALRSSIIENPHKSSEKALLMELLELISHRWKDSEIPADVRALYDKYRSISYPLRTDFQCEQDVSDCDKE